MTVPDQQDHRADKLQQALPDEQAHLLHIVGGADHQLAGLVLVVIGKDRCWILAYRSLRRSYATACEFFSAQKACRKEKTPRRTAKTRMATRAVIRARGALFISAVKRDLELVQRHGRVVAESFENLRQCRAINCAGILSSACKTWSGEVTAGDRVDHIADHARHSQLRKRGDHQENIR